MVKNKNFIEYKYKINNETEKVIEVPEEIEHFKNQAIKDYKTSKNYIDNYERYIWEQGYKSYHLSTYDRKVQLGKDTWKQNISIGLVRAYTDVLKAAVKEKPLTFIGTGINKAGIENKDAIIDTLNYISDVTGFHTQLKKTMGDALLTGEICMRIGYKKTNKQEKIVSIINGENIEEIIEVEEQNYPYTVNVNIFNIFPDPYTGPLRYVTERGVVSYLNFIETFGHLIRSKNNKSPLKSEDFLPYLAINKLPGTDFRDYGAIVNKIHQKINEECMMNNYYDRKLGEHYLLNHDENEDVLEGLIEFRITYYENNIVLIANGYPVYVGPNIYGFIPYIIKAANETDARFGEGIPYLLKGLEDVRNSFINNYFDSARSIANPTIVANKNLLINDYELENGTPGGVLYTESNEGGYAVYRLDKGGLHDFNILEIIQSIAQQITGISEYNLGIARRERTATGALSVATSSIRRMSPYMSSFLDALSEVAKMWLKLVKKFWTTEQFIYVLDENGNQLAKTINNKNLLGQINISLAAEGVFGTVNELEVQKLLNMYTLLAKSPNINASEIEKEILKRFGFSPSRFIIPPEEQPAPEDMSQEQRMLSSQIGIPTAGPKEAPVLPKNGGVKDLDLGQIIQQSINPQINLGHKGKGNS